MSILLIEHDMDVVFDLVDRITVLHMGQFLAEGTPQEIQADQNVTDIYLGTAGEELFHLMLEIDDVHTYYGDSYVLQGMSLNVGKRVRGSPVGPERCG